MSRGLRRWALGPMAALVLLGAGCNTYHYFDIQVKFDTTQVDETQAGYLQRCTIDITGAASDSIVVPDNNSKKSYCPITDFQTFPVLGTFEFSTFADSGKLTFTFDGYYTGRAMDSSHCATGSVSVDASSEITQMAELDVGSGPAGACVSATQQ